MGESSHQGNPVENSAPLIRSVNIRTVNVAKELMQTAALYKVPVNTLDFHLNNVQTFARNLEKGDSWEELTASEIAMLDERDFLNPKFELKQSYDIEIFQIEGERPADSIDISIGGNNALTKIYLTVKAGSMAKYSDHFEIDFFRQITKKKLRANVMVGIFESVMMPNLTELLAKIRVEGEYRFVEQERYLIAQAVEAEPTIDDRLIMHYQAKKSREDEHGRIDYSKRDYVVSVVENDLIIEYVKPKKGGNGRNCRGEFVPAREPVVKYQPSFNVGENILVNETDKGIEYRARVSGYVTFEGGTYNIRTDLEVSEISFRTTGSIDTDLNADVSISVKEKDALKDAIGMGMEVTVHEIHIEGNIGPSAKVTAMKASVQGQVHQSAIIKADNLDIHIHKGLAIGKEVHISRLEHGTVQGEIVRIDQATGGKIRAKEIIIDTLGSNVKMTASKKIEIHTLVGGENEFKIDPLLNESDEKLSEQSKQTEYLKKLIKEIEKEVEGYEKTWHDNQPVIDDIKRKLAHYKSNGIKLPTAFVQKYQQHLHFKEKLDALKEELRTKKDRYDFLTNEHAALQNEIFEARIINYDRWKTRNEIIFKLIDPPIEISYIPKENSAEQVLGLFKDEDDEYSIQVVS